MNQGKLKEKIQKVKKKIEDFAEKKKKNIERNKEIQKKTQEEISKINKKTSEIDKEAWISKEEPETEEKVEDSKEEEAPVATEAEIIETEPSKNEEAIEEPLENKESEGGGEEEEESLGINLLYSIKEFLDEWGALILKIVLSILFIVIAAFGVANYSGKQIKIPQKENKTEEEEKNKIIVSSKVIRDSIKAGTKISLEPLFSEGEFAVYLKEITGGRNLLKNNVQEIIWKSDDREGKYREILLKTREHKKKFEENHAELKQKIAQLSSRYQYARDKKNELENDFFSFIKGGNAAMAHKYLEEFIKYKKEEAEIAANLGALKRISSYYKFYYPRLKVLEKSLIANRDPLIEAIEVVNIKNMPRDLIESEREWEESLSTEKKKDSEF